VNGGQTARILASVKQKGQLKPDVNVVVRIITSDRDREFAGNVAVNLNNQTIVKPAFLRSNHPAIIQLQSTLLTKGYYLERKEGDIALLSEEERIAIERSIGGKINERKIELYVACQAYVAFYMRNIDVAKRNPKKIFLSREAGGIFEQFVNTNVSSEKFIYSWELYKKIVEFKKDYLRARRKNDTKKIDELIGRDRKNYNVVELDELAPQSPIFILAVVGHKYGENPIDVLNKNTKLVDTFIVQAYRKFSKSRTLSKTSSSWPTLLKSQTFLESALKAEKRVIVVKAKPISESAPTKDLAA
jgi:hypothetical protein